MWVQLVMITMAAKSKACLRPFRRWDRLRPFRRWDRGFESHWRHGCLCVFMLPVCSSGLATCWSPA
jgi:hypothetical protein